jgi:hypothetical protein
MMMKQCAGVLLLVTGAVAFAPPSSSKVVSMKLNTNRRNVLLASSLFGGFFGGNQNPASAAKPTTPGAKGPTNEIGKVAKSGMKMRRLGGSDILVSELGLGTQRWASADFNAPDEDTCREFMVRNCTSVHCWKLVKLRLPSLIPKSFSKPCPLSLLYSGQGNSGKRGELDRYCRTVSYSVGWSTSIRR